METVVMPIAGEVFLGFIVEAGRSWRMVYDHNLQATHRDERPAWTGRWRSPKGDCWWQVRACPITVEAHGVAGVRPAAFKPKGRPEQRFGDTQRGSGIALLRVRRGHNLVR